MNNLEAVKERLVMLRLLAIKQHLDPLENVVATDLEAALRVVGWLMRWRGDYDPCGCCAWAYRKHSKDCPLVWWEEEAP